MFWVNLQSFQGSGWREAGGEGLKPKHCQVDFSQGRSVVFTAIKSKLKNKTSPFPVAYKIREGLQGEHTPAVLQNRVQDTVSHVPPQTGSACARMGTERSMATTC